jgi:hypothetical protein
VLSSLVPRKVAIKLVLDQIEEGVYSASMFNRLFEDVEGVLRVKFSEFADWSAPSHSDHRESHKGSRVKAFAKILVPLPTSLCIFLFELLKFCLISPRSRLRRRPKSSRFTLSRPSSSSSRTTRRSSQSLSATSPRATPSARGPSVSTSSSSKTRNTNRTKLCSQRREPWPRSTSALALAAKAPFCSQTCSTFPLPSLFTMRSVR